MSASSSTVRELDPSEYEAWDQAVDELGGRVHQATWWASPLAPYGIAFRVVGRFAGSRLTGGALVRILRAQKVPVTLVDCIGGPIGADWDEAQIRGLVDVVEGIARQHRTILVSFLYVPDAGVHGLLERELRARRGAVRATASSSETIIDLDGRTPDEVFAGFHRSARRFLRIARASGVETRVLTGEEELSAACDCLAASAERQQFMELRPRPALLSLMRHGAERGDAVTIGAFAGDELVATVVVTLVGRHPEYLYGGYRKDVVDGAKVYPNYLLQAAAIELAIERGKAGYSLGFLGNWRGSKGVDDFKLRLGAAVVESQPTLQWEVRPIFVRALDVIRTNKWGKRVNRRIRQMSEAAGARSHAGSSEPSAP